MVSVAAQPAGAPPAATQPATPASSVNIRLMPDGSLPSGAKEPTFTARFTGKSLRSLLNEQTPLLPLPFQLEEERAEYIAAVDRIGMGSVVEKLQPWLAQACAGQFDAAGDTIRVPVSVEQQVEIQPPGEGSALYRGPKEDVVGFLLHDVTEEEYLRTAVRVMNVARQLLDTGDARYDRTSQRYYSLLAASEVEALVSSNQKVVLAAKARELVRRSVGTALGLTYDEKTKRFEGEPRWSQESRRFMFVVDAGGEFIDRIKPTVERINREMADAGFLPSAPTGKPGIYFDKDINEVDIVLPTVMMATFLEEVDRLEIRMAEDNVISIEAVRLTDSEIINGAIASRLTAQVQGVHDVTRVDNRGILREASINSLLAVANYQLDLAHFQGINNGVIPAGTTPLSLPGLTLPSPVLERSSTTVGSDFSIGADEIFFDGRQQSYGFSYIGPDGRAHTMSLDVVDSLREFWDRIERNLIVHKILKKKNEVLVPFSVPVGPKDSTFEGIAALISQRDQDIVVATGTGAIEKLQASAGTWLVIQDFEIAPLPGASTTLTTEEIRELEARVLMTMFLRDPTISVEEKIQLVHRDPPLTAVDEGDGTDDPPRPAAAVGKRDAVDAPDRNGMNQRLRTLYESRRARQIRSGLNVPTYEAVFERRLDATLAEARVEKRERNSKITLSFYSSQGDIIQTPASGGGATLGDQNDLTSFTTEVRPNIVTPISSFLTRQAGGSKGLSPLTGVTKGESKDEQKNMTHLVIRARFPTAERERADLAEGRFLGYFQLPLGREPHSQVDLPFLSSSEHPLTRLSELRVGLMFPALQRDKVRKPLGLINPNQLQGTVPLNVWETATTRMLLLRKIISDSLHADQALAAEYNERFEIEVRSLLEYDEDFFDLPNIALRNTVQWNDPDRIVVALNNSTGKFALDRMVDIIDALGSRLVTDEYAARNLGASRFNLWGRHRVRPLTEEELRELRRDVANHYLRVNESYGDAFLGAVSAILQLGTYNATDAKQMLKGPFRGYRDLVVFDAREGQGANLALYEGAEEAFAILLAGGYKGRLGERSLVCIEDLPAEYRRFVTRGNEVLERVDWWWYLDPR